MAHIAALEGLNEQQLAAVSRPHGVTLVLAGPGSGKTRVLTQRIACLVERDGVPPRSILAVTFTNKAAREMRTRLDRILGDDARQVTLGTFHSVCARILRREAAHFGLSHDFLIYDRDDQVTVIRHVLKALNVDDKQYRPAAVLGEISRAKNDMISAEAYRPPSYWHEVVGRAYLAYQKALEQAGALDFDDLLLATVHGFEAAPEVLQRHRARYRHVLVDEFQDTNMPQYRLVRLLADDETDIFLVGDEDQSIYGWRGADYRNLQRVRADFPKVETVLLERNYRSTQTIVSAASAVIAKNKGRVAKVLKANGAGGEPVRVWRAQDPDDEARAVVSEIERLVASGHRLGDFAIMYRMNAQSRAIEDAFMRRGLPYRLVGGTRFYQRREVKDVLSYLRLLASPNDWTSFDRVVNVPPRGLGDVSLGRLRQCAQVAGLGPYDALVRLRDDGAWGGLTGRARNSLLEFLDVWDSTLESVDAAGVAELIDQIGIGWGYAGYLRSSGPEAEDRLANIEELRGVAAEHFAPGWEELSRFLDEVALVADADELGEESAAPVLMTLHTAKGLEFPVVFMVGMVEGILPHSRSLDSPDQLEEERRLCYVGMTRAEKLLYLTHSAERRLYGQSGMAMPSQFLKDLPVELTSTGRGEAPTGAEASRASRFSASWATPPLSKPAKEPVPVFSTGESVVHPAFGTGVVIEYQAKDGDAEVSVAFKGRGVKRLLVSLAKLQRS